MTAAVSNPVKPLSRHLDVQRIRAQFPILQSTFHGKPLVYLDNGATTQKPQQVIDAITHYYEQQNANIHRGVYQLSQIATDAYESARLKIAAFINAPDPKEIIYTRGTTEGINLVAHGYGRQVLRASDEVIVSAMEHHSNIVPWQIACDVSGATLRVIPMNDAGELLMDEYAKLLGPRTRLVSVVHISNSLGTINDVRTIAEMAHAVGAKVLIDGAQWVAHFPTDVQALGADFYAFSGHKLYGPTGIGVLWGRRELLESIPPYQGGGDMIESVTFEKTTYAPLPNRFEAGTPHIAGAVGLGAAIDFVQSMGFDSFAPYEHEVFDYASARIAEIPGLRVIGAARHKSSVISFVMDDPPVSSLDIGMFLDAQGIAVRTGHHCCQPVMKRMDIASTARASFAMYNTRDEVDALVASLHRLREKYRAKPKAPSLALAPPAEGQDVTQAIYPEPLADSPEAAAAELADIFEFLGDRDARNQYIMEMGEKLLPMPGEMKTEQTRVHGCMSTVHLFGRRRPGTTDTLEFLADSDAHIVRGLIALLQKIYSGKRAPDILKFDVEGFFRRIGLDQFISSQRRNGLAGMVQRIQSLASALGK